MNCDSTSSSNSCVCDFRVSRLSCVCDSTSSSKSIQFEKIEYGNISCFLCNDGGWQLNKELGFHKLSSARDCRRGGVEDVAETRNSGVIDGRVYHVQWIE